MDNTGKVRVMGVLNITPDSFSDGGAYPTTDLALEHAQQMLFEGADIIDIGGESTRPNAELVGTDDELKRVIPVIKALSDLTDACISIDTTKPEVMRRAVASGARLINDVNALQAPFALETARALKVDVCLMHRQGTAQTMQNNPIYDDVVETIKAFFDERINACIQAGLRADKLILDPGFGFGKTLQHNLTILNRLNELKSFGLPLLVGISRKSMIGSLLKDRNTDGRLPGSIAAAVIAAQNGADIVRVHDVLATKDALMILQGVRDGFE